MKWNTDWWGITITSENEADNILIDMLTKALPAKTENAYEEGYIEIKTNDGLKSIILHR